MSVIHLMSVSRAFDIGTHFICKILVYQSDNFCHILFPFEPSKLVDPNETLYYQASKLGLHCLLYMYFRFEQLVREYMHPRSLIRSICLQVFNEVKLSIRASMQRHVDQRNIF